MQTFGTILQTGEDLKLGTMSFKMKADEEFDINWFNLLGYADDMPSTGIKISLDGIKYFEYAGDAKKTGTFRFVDATASKNADLNDLKVHKDVIDDTDPDNQVTVEEEILIIPEFEKDTLDYEITLMEYLDEVKVCATLADEKATMKIKIPKRDDDRQLRV